MMEISKGFRVVIFFALVIGSTQAMYKRWLPDTNFENPANWNGQRAPCGNDVVIIPDDSPVVYVQMNTTLRELALPANGELILGTNAGFTFTDSASTTSGSSADCPDTGGDLEFIATQPEAWLNPSSWCSTPSERGTCDVQTPMLDVEKVPCAFDDVIFPRQHSYFVDLTEQVPTLTVKSMKISGTSFTSSSFVRYLKSTDGQRMFKTPSQTSSRKKIDVTRKSCREMKGCACGNDQPEIASKICTHVEKTCKRPRCKDTVQPVGSCCRMCGAVFNITRGYGFDFGTFKKLLNDEFLSDSSVKNSVNVTMSVTYEGWIQVALIDLTGKKSSDLARRIKSDMDKDLSDGGHKYAIDAVKLLFSTGNPLIPLAHTVSQGLAGGSIAGIVIAVLIILAILAVIIVLFVFHRTGREIPINIPKLPNVTMPSLPRIPVRLQRSTTRVPEQPQTASHVDPGFANPLYDTSPFDDGNVVKEMELIAATKESQPTFDTSGSGFNNPLYGADGSMMFSDPTKTDEEQEKEASPTPKSETPAKPTTSVLIEFKKDDADDSTI